MSEGRSFGQIFQYSFHSFKENFRFIVPFYFVYLVLDWGNYFLQTKVFFTEDQSRVVEIIFQLALVLMTVFFFHTLNLKKLSLNHSFGKIIAEGFFLTPGYILQSLFFVLAVLMGGVLLIIPGIYAFIVFYFAPVVAVLYPDYQGKLFFHTKEMADGKMMTTIFMILFTAIVPFIPDGIVFLITGTMKNGLMAIITPVDGAVYLFCQLMVFEFVFELVNYDRKRSS